MRNKLSTALALILALSAPAAMAQTSSSESSSSDSSDSSDSSGGSTDSDTADGDATDAGSSTDNTGDGMDGENTEVTEDDGDVEGDGAISEDATDDGVEDDQPGSAGLTIEQQTQFRTAVTEAQVEALALSSLEFDIASGVVVPGTVTLQPVPEAIVQAVPAYEGFLYFVLDDGRIVVVNPDTLEIALVIEA